MRGDQRRLLATLIFGLAVFSAFAAFSSGTTHAVGAGHVPSVVHHDAAPVRAATHGDLVVGPSNSPYVLSPATVGGSTYGQGGNISVLSGGKLVVRNLTLDFLQYIVNNGTAGDRLGHLFWFNDRGSVYLENAILTTDTSILNAYAKLNVSVTNGGQFTANNSALLFPGWLSASGAGSWIIINSTLVGPNPGVFTQRENLTIQRDTVSGPDLRASAGAQVFLNGSSLSSLYRHNVSRFGWPGPLPLVSNATQLQTNSTATASFPAFRTPTDSENLSRDALYPTFQAAQLIINYSSGAGLSTGPNTFTYGSSWAIGQIHYPGASLANLSVRLPAAALNAINSGGVASFLQATGMFGGASGLAVTLGTTNTPVDVHYIALQLIPAVDYNITVTGAGTVFSAVDTTLNLNWNLTAGTPVPSGIPGPTPWGSNKLNLSQGAAAYLGNISVTTPRTSVYWNQSAVLPDSTSTAYFFRWANVPVASSTGLTVPDAQISAYYAYNSNQTNNATATALNNLATSDPVLGAFVANDAKARGLLNYGVTGEDGVGRLLLANGVLTQSNLPDGIYLGGYHLLATLAGGGANSTHWGYAGLTPYPSGMSPASPDHAGSIVFPNYQGKLGVTSISVAANGTAGTAWPIGTTITVTANLTNLGTAPITRFTAELDFVRANDSVEVPLTTAANYTGLAANGVKQVTFNWTIDESVTGDHGTFTTNLAVIAIWNGGQAPNGGETTGLSSLTVQPSTISLNIQNPPTGNFPTDSVTAVTGTVIFAGKNAATIMVTAVGGGGAIYELGLTTSPSGPFVMDLSAPATGIPAGTYSVVATASYNGRNATQTFANAITIPGAGGPGQSFLDQTFLGIPLLWWIIIAVIVVVGAIGAMFAVGRYAKGKLVECGECGHLIPEKATTCPNCGAEFEVDLVRCSRCGSTIPAASKVCPECSAFLLGKETEAEKDPERQAYADYVERFRGQAKKDLGENYSEGAFWDWWKRQSSYLAFNQWQLQQAQGGRTGMSAPPTSDTATPLSTGASARPGGARPPPAAAAPARGAAPRAAPTARPTAAAAPTPSPAAAPVTSGMKPCPNCGKEILPDYLVCPFCGAVTG